MYMASFSTPRYTCITRISILQITHLTESFDGLVRIIYTKLFLIVNNHVKCILIGQSTEETENIMDHGYYI